MYTEVKMGIKEDVEDGVQKGIREPLIEEQKNRMVPATRGHPWMIYFSTFVAVCGSYEFGACVSVLVYSSTLFSFFLVTLPIPVV